MIDTPYSDELDEIISEHNVYFWKQEGKTVKLSDEELRLQFKQRLSRLLIDAKIDELLSLGWDKTKSTDPILWCGDKPDYKVLTREERIAELEQQRKDLGDE